MKHQECVYMPSTVEDWLREQLVKRGIDAVLFTQYILNLIQSVFLNKSGLFLNNFEQNGLEMLVSELCVNLIDAVNKCEVVTPFLDPDHCISDCMRGCDMCGSGSKSKVSEHMSVLQDSKMELDLQAILGDDEVPPAHTKGPRAAQKCRRDLFLAFTQSLSHEEPKENSTIPLGYNDLRVPRVETEDQNVSHGTVSRCSDQLIDVSSDDDSPKTEDRNLARLIAKFDSSIEALWNPDEPLNGPDFTESSDDLNGSFQTLDPSPFPLDIPNSKQNSFSFLPYGTDICSIWSSQPSPEELKSLECKNDVWSVPEHIIESLVCEVKENAGTSDAGTGTDSLAALNHSKEGSSFIEVKPKKKPLTVDILLDPSPQQESKMEPVEKRRKEKEEEPVDLLVSQTTHFSPIRKEARTRSKKQTEPTRYEDGTTFSIPNAIKRIDFTRSASGSLYLQQGGTSPKQFMEFKEGRSVQGGAHFDRDFVPKFRVKQNEKWCQTDREDLDEGDCCLKSEEEKAPAWAQINIKCLEKDLEEQVEEEVRKTIEGRHVGRNVGRNEKKDACFKCGNPPSWVSDWLTATEPTTVTGIWQGAFTLMTLEPASQRGYPAWSEADGSNGLCWECVANAENHKSQLRQELIQEGEQLLTDLNLNTLSFLLDEKRDHPEKVADFAAPFSKSPKMEAEWTAAPLGIYPGRPTARCAQRERKRRLSSSQRACSYYMEGNCRRAHCRFAHDLAAVPCRFWGDSSCLKGDKCPNLHATLRPVTL